MRHEYLPWLVANAGPARVIVNVVGFELDEYAEVVEGLETIDGITAYELNLVVPQHQRRWHRVRR